MDERTRALVELSSAIARGARAEWRERMRAAQSVAQPEAIEEAILQSYLFLGYPTALQALAVWRELMDVAITIEGPEDPEHLRARGERACATVYGGQYERLRANITRLHPDLEAWMISEGYGKVLGRPGLELKTRELCIIGLLAAQDAAHQLHSHLRGALNAGASVAEVEAALAVVLRALPSGPADAARQLWSEVRSKRKES